MNPSNKIWQAFGILTECFGDNGVWADPTRYRRQCWVRDFNMAIQPLLLDIGQTEIAAKHLRSIEARQRKDGQIPIVFLDGLAGHARFIVDKTRKSLRDGKMSFMLGRYLQGQLGQLTPGTRDSELHYIIAALEHEEKTGKLPVSMDSIQLAMRYIKWNLLNSKGLIEGADWRDTMEKELRNKALLSNNALLCHAYDLLAKHHPFYRSQEVLMRRLINETFWDGIHLQDWPGNKRFDPLGASLAVLYGIIPENMYPWVLEGFNSVDSEYGVTIKCRHNPISAEEAEVIERTDGVVVWPFVVGFATLAMLKMSKKAGNLIHHVAQWQFDKLTALEGFREWYDPATGKGYGATRQLWSATLFARAYLALENS